jgi:uncharacterized protein (DUF1697 family)
VARFVVLLRGVNVGKGNRVPMAGFRALLEDQGFTAVRTLLNSGNAVFAAGRGSAATHARAIGAALQGSLGVKVAVVVKTAAEFSAAVAGNTLDAPERAHSRLLVAFAQEPGALRALASLAPRVQPPERFVVGRQAAYLLCPGGLMGSAAAKALLGKSGQAVTTRNWATVLKLRDLLG